MVRHVLDNLETGDGVVLVVEVVNHSDNRLVKLQQASPNERFL